MIYAQSADQTISFAGGAFNATEPTIASVNPATYADWTAVIFTAHEFFNSTSTLTVDFLSATDPSGISHSTSAPLAYTASSGWFQYVRVQLGEDGHAYVYYLQNSTAGSPITIFSCGACWMSNGTTIGTLASNHESNINYGEDVFVTVSQDNGLSVGTVNATDGSLNYWVNGFGLPSAGLAGTGTTDGLSLLGAATGSYVTPAVSAGVAHPCMVTARGYVQVELNPSGFSNTQTMSGFFSLILEIVPIFILTAVLGLVLKVFKGFKF
jgi:hypothetical protein